MDLNNATGLECNTEKLAKTTNFLNLTIELGSNGTILSRTNQKPMNLFLYIPSHLAHPPGQLQSLIYGLMKTYQLQNTHWKDFMNTVSLLYNRLAAHVHWLNFILRKFQMAHLEHLSK